MLLLTRRQLQLTAVSHFLCSLNMQSLVPHQTLFFLYLAIPCVNCERATSKEKWTRCTVLNLNSRDVNLFSGIGLQLQLDAMGHVSHTHIHSLYVDCYHPTMTVKFKLLCTFSLSKDIVPLLTPLLPYNFQITFCRSWKMIKYIKGNKSKG